MGFFLLKTEPETFSFDDLLSKESEPWNGVRNYQARNFMKEMKPGDLCLIYHSGKEKAVVGLAEVCSTPYQELADDQRWVCVDIKALHSIEPFTLNEIKQNNELQNIMLLKQSRLSVMPLTEIEFNILTNSQ